MFMPLGLKLSTHNTMYLHAKVERATAAEQGV